MAADIVNAKPATTTVINNGSLSVATGGKGAYTVITTSGDASHLPTIATISGLYDAKFDDRSYYVS